MDDVTKALVEAGATATDPFVTRSPLKTGRSGSGKLRNFKAMKDDKFRLEAAFVLAENNDPEAIELVMQVAQERGIVLDAPTTLVQGGDAA